MFRFTEYTLKYLSRGWGKKEISAPLLVGSQRSCTPFKKNPAQNHVAQDPANFVCIS